MVLLIQAAPLLAIALLLGTGRADPLRAALVGLALAVPAAAVSVGSGLSPLVATEAARGAWLALQPIAVTFAGLLVHGAISARAASGRTSPPPTHARLFTCVFLLGPFFETVTGFGIGVVFALAELARLGVRGPVAAALSLLSQVLIPWGALGPGTLLGAALAGVSLTALGAWTSILTAAWLMLLVPLFWGLAREAGLPATPRDRIMGLATMAALAGLLVAGNVLASVEVAGLLALGPVILARAVTEQPGLLRDPPVREAAPYLALTVLLLGTRLIPGLPGLLTSVLAPKPWSDLPAFALLHHPASILAAVAVAVMSSLPGGQARIVRLALHHAAKPAALVLAYVTLSRILAGSGAAASLAGALGRASGPALPVILPMLGAAGGFFAGNNVGSNSILMPIQAGLSAGLGLPGALGPAVQNFMGSAFCLLAPMRIGATAALAGGGAGPLFRRIWPAGAAALLVGMVATVLGALNPSSTAPA